MSKKKAYVIGTKTSTSLSPTIFEYWFDKYSIDGEYKHKEIKEDEFDKEIKLILKKDELCGLNITTPFKEKILPHLNNLDSEATKAGSVNCVTKTNSSLEGKNTDGAGFLNALLAKDIKQMNGWPASHKSAIIIGFGGAAKSIISILPRAGFSRIYVFNRNYEKIRTASNEIGFIPMKLEELEKIFNYQQIETKIESLYGSSTKNEARHIKPHIVVNTTPINVLQKMNIRKDRFQAFPHTMEWIGYDIVYRPKEGTGFLKYFVQENTVEGIDMLVHQAAPCFELWFGVKPEIDKNLFNVLYKKMGEDK